MQKILLQIKIKTAITPAEAPIIGGYDPLKTGNNA